MNIPFNITSNYFKASRPLPDGSMPPPPLIWSVNRKVRFNEVDPIRVLWHGHYASYFEDGRMAFGEHYGIGYQDFFSAEVVAPIRQMHIDYTAPLRFDEECSITTILFWNDAARLNFEYLIYDNTGKEVTRGYTVQLFLTPSGELYYAKPDFYEDFCIRWKAGKLS